MNRILWEIKNFYYNIKRIIEWIPVLWNNYDFDYRYAIDIFIFKLNKIADLLDSNKSYTENASQKAKRIRLAIKLLNRGLDDYYHEEAMLKVTELYGEKEMITKPIDDKPGTFSIDFVWVKDLTPEEMEEADKFYSKMIKEGYAKDDRAIKLAWRIIEQDIRGWWD
jgi:hypothetical protein